MGELHDAAYVEFNVSWLGVELETAGSAEMAGMCLCFDFLALAFHLLLGLS